MCCVLAARERTRGVQNTFRTDLTAPTPPCHKLTHTHMPSHTQYSLLDSEAKMQVDHPSVLEFARRRLLSPMP
eukprot:1370811-Rhodomonas_salina.1